jgi:hypothetical protein
MTSLHREHSRGGPHQFPFSLSFEPFGEFRPFSSTWAPCRDPPNLTPTLLAWLVALADRSVGKVTFT